VWIPPGLEYIRRLGQGGGAHVHLLEDSETGERVSLKLADSHADPSLREALKREVEILTDIEYAGLPAVRDSGTDDGRTWYTYQHIEGLPLARMEGASGRKAFNGVALGLLGALHVLSDLGWVHYDVSPDNVLVGDPEDWESVTLIDLGHAGRPGRTLLGTPGYMAPEILRGEPGGPAGDLYAAGVTLIEYALGERLFAGCTQRTVTETLAVVRDGVRDRLEAAVGRDRAQALLAMTDPNPASRPADAWSVLPQFGGVPRSLIDATMRAVVNGGLPPIGAGDQARADLAAGLKSIRWEAGSASAIADRVAQEMTNPRFDLARFLACLTASGHVERSSGAWLLTRFEEESLALGFDRQESIERIASLSKPSRMALLLLAATAEYQDDSAVEWVTRLLIPELDSLEPRLVRGGRTHLPAYATLLRSVADPEELNEARMRAAGLLTEEGLRPARLFLRLRAGRADDTEAAGLLLRISRQGRLRESSQIADAVEALDTAPEELLISAAWARAEMRDWEGCRRLIARVEGDGTAVRLLDAVVDVKLEGRVQWRRGEIVAEESGEAAIARLSIDLAVDEKYTIEAACKKLRALSPFDLDTGSDSPAQVLGELAPLITPPFPMLSHCVMSIASTIGKRLFAAGDTDGAREVYATAQKMAEGVGLAGRASRFEGNYANCLIQDGETGKAAEILEGLAHRREAMGDTVGAITVWGNLGVIRFNEGEADGALVSWERQAALVREAGRTRKLGSVTCRIACALQEIGSWGSAREAFESAIRLSRSADDTDTEVLSRLNLTSLLIAEGDTARAETEWQELANTASEIELSPDRSAEVVYCRARIDLEYGRRVLDREEMLRVIESRGEDVPPSFETLTTQMRLEVAIRNAKVLGEYGDYRSYLDDPEEDPVLALTALSCALPVLDSDEELLGFVERLPEGVVSTDVAEAMALYTEILIRLEADRGRSPGQLVQEAHEFAHRCGLPGLLWRSHLALGLKSLRRGQLKHAALAFGTALRCFRECHAPGSLSLPGTLRRRTVFHAFGQGIRRLARRLGVKRSVSGEDSLPALMETLSGCALELAERGEGGGKWELGIEKVLSVTETLNSTVKLDPLLAQIVESVLDLCDAEYGFMVLLDDDGEPSIRVARGGFKRTGEAAESQVSNTLIQRVLSRRQSILIQNALDEKDLVDKPSVQMLSLQSIMCAPLVYKEKLLGAILVDNRTAAGCFTRDDQRLLEVFASQASIAIQNTRLFEDLEKSYRSLEDAQERLLRSEKLRSLGVLAGGIAHDFNNLLMSMLGNADLALMYLPEPSPANNHVSEIKNAALQAGNLCNQMLAYSGKGQFVVGALDLTDASRQVSEMLSASVSENVRLTWDLKGDLPGIEADATQIRQVILGLVTNAAEACGDKGGAVFIETGARHFDADTLAGKEYVEQVPAGEYVFLSVRDTGSGMDKEARARLFEPFFTTKFTGRGLGLSAALGIVRGHEGTIRVESEPGGGSTLTVLFPARQSHVEPAPVVAPADDEWVAGGTVLLVDDEEMVREVAREMLRELGVEVVTAQDGIEALDIFRERGDQIDLVILDMNMPRMSGDETFREIRRIREDARIVISSGYSEADTAGSFADEMPSGFLEKPYELAVLREKLHSLLADGR